MRDFIKKLLEDNNYQIAEEIKDIEDSYLFAKSSEMSSYVFVLFISGFSKFNKLLNTSKTSLLQKYFEKINQYQKAPDLSKNVSLIVCLELTTINVSEKDNKLLLEFEENPYLFKKYVFTYTKKQFQLFNENVDMHKLLNNQIQSMLSNATEFEKFSENPFADSSYNFLTKVYIKFPFLSLAVDLYEKYASLSEYINSKIKNKGSLFEKFYFNIVDVDISAMMSLTDEDLLRKLAD